MIYNLGMLNSVQSLACPNCGSPLPAGAVGGTIIKCQACGTTFTVPSTFTPEPDMARLLLAADFQNKLVPGWKVWDQKKPPEFAENEGIPELLVTLEPEPEHLSPYLITTPGILDDFDACVSIRFLEGDTVNFFAGLDLRGSEAGCYQVAFDSGGKFEVIWFENGKWGGNLVKWCDESALKHGFEVRNTLRVSMRGPQMRIYLNGIFSVSLHDSRFSAGELRVIASPYEKEMRLAISNLQVHEAK